VTCYSIGIDNGVSGALAALDSEGGLIGWLPMPTVKARKGNEIDVCAVWCWIQDMTCGETTTPIYTIEEPGGSKSAKAGASMAGSFHAIRAMLAVKRCRMQRVTPQSWQRVLLPGCKAGDTKARAYEAARRMWPDERWHATERCKVAHDGGIDAALIALYGSSLINSGHAMKGGL
jgi:hypothetical protein